MNIEIVLTDKDGKKFRGTVHLQPVDSGQSQPLEARQGISSKPQECDFSLPIRAFHKRHCAGKSGQKRFAILTAYLAKGRFDEIVTAKDIELNWRKMTALMGKFNPAYSTRAKDNGWVDTSKPGQYTLRPTWKSVLTEN